MAPNERCVTYRRVSGEVQVQGTSLDQQLELCRQKAKQLNLAIVGEFADEGVSGDFFKLRPGLQAALKEIEEGRAEVLLVALIDRMARSVGVFAKIEQVVKKAGGRVLYANLDMDTSTPEGSLAKGFFQQFAAYEHDVIVRRFVNGKVEKVAEGYMTARTFQPFGWHIITRRDVEEGRYPKEMAGKYITIPEEAALIRDAMTRYADGQISLPGIATEWNEKGIQTRQGGIWRAPALSSIFKSRRLLGEATFGRFQHIRDENQVGTLSKYGRPIKSPTTKLDRLDPANARRITRQAITIPIPPIVDEALYERVQARLEGNKARLGGKPTQRRLLSGLVFCSNGHSMRHISTKARKDAPTRRYYECSARVIARRERGVDICAPNLYRAEVLEDSVITAILDACQRPEVLAEAIAEFNARSSTQIQADKARKELTSIDAALESVMNF